MKKYTLALALVALVPFVSASAYEYKGSQSGYYRGSAKTSSYKNASNSRKKSGYNNLITNNFYYIQPSQPSVQKQSIKQSGGYYYEEKQRKSGFERKYSSKERKFFLAHPFFQPLKGKFGSVTDFSYAQSAFNFDLLTGTVLDIDKSSPTYGFSTPQGVTGIEGKAEASQFVIKEDVSFGLTDTLSLVLMAQYDSTKTEFKDWSGGEPGDNKKSSGLNIFGIGLQDRFVDDDEWIMMAEGYFQHQKDTANTIMGGLKAGYKIDRTTVYALGRIGYSSLIKGDTYGMFVDDSTGDWLMLSYNTNVNEVFQVEGGVGAFAVLNKYITLNGELTFGHYDWHNQLNIKGAIGYQPTSMFALNLYASTVLHDSANGKKRLYMNYDVNPTDFPEVGDTEVFTDSKLLYTYGDYKIKDYNEWKIGVQAILYF